MDEHRRRIAICGVAVVCLLYSYMLLRQSRSRARRRRLFHGKVNDQLTQVSDEELNFEDVKRYKCHKCPFKTKYKSNLRIHLIVRHNIKNLKHKRVNELEGDREAPKLLTPNGNIVQAVSEKSLFMCEISSPEKFECRLCDFKCDLRLTLQRHINSIHYKINDPQPNLQIQCYECCICNLRTCSLLVFARHVCREFGQAERVSFEELHIEEIGPQQSFQQKTKQSNSLNKKQTTIKPIVWHKCTKCDYKTNNRKNLQRHIVRMHTEQGNINWLQCELCPHRAKEKWSLKAHILTKHREPKNIKWYTCEKCSFKMKHKNSLREHLLFQHNTEDIVWFECKQCSCKLKSKRNVRAHILSKHTDPKLMKWFYCEQCSYKTIRKANLKRHVSVRHKKYV